MKESDVRWMAAHGSYQGSALHGKVEETHISWVILSRPYVFKIKKPIQLSFLDFTTLKLRKLYCEREVKLNNRFTDIYLGVEPIRLHDGQYTIGGREGRVVDYAVKMKRMDVSKRMDKQLHQGKVAPHHMHALAGEIAAFHRRADVIHVPFRLPAARTTFNDIRGVRQVILRHLGKQYAGWVDRSVAWSNDLLKKHARRFKERVKAGYVRDVHGDLHSGNIFLYQKPVLFDCLEFNDAYRQIDVLYEIAFFCMDLEAFQQKRLASLFLKDYNRLLPSLVVPEDRVIFQYFKCLRANVRAKVHAMSILQAETPEELSFHTREVRKYLKLMIGYVRE